MENAVQLTYDRAKTGRQIRYLREERNISCEEMAEILDIPEKNLTDIEEGRSGISLERALQIAAFFDMAIDDLINTANDAVQKQRDREEEAVLSLLENSDPQQLTTALELMRRYLLE